MKKRKINPKLEYIIWAIILISCFIAWYTTNIPELCIR